METISNTLFWISNGLLVPVIVLLLLFFLRAILLAGGFFGEFYQRMKLQKQFAETLENITPENIDGLLQQLPSAGNSPLLRSMSKLSAHRMTTPTANTCLPIMKWKPRRSWDVRVLSSSWVLCWD